jgi:CarD family transcriptional regulator
VSAIEIVVTATFVILRMARLSHVRKPFIDAYFSRFIRGFLFQGSLVELGFNPQQYERLSMTFKVGETVVYPHHGAALIEAIETRVIKGEERTYLVLKVAQGDLTVRVPADNVDLVGVRDVVDSAGLDRVFNVLRQPYTEEPTNWSRRYKANLEKLASGDVIKVAEVVRDLYRRDLDRGLSAGEKRMLAKAKQILVSELALAERTDEEKAATLLDEVLAS